LRLVGDDNDRYDGTRIYTDADGFSRINDGKRIGESHAKAIQKRIRVDPLSSV